jgi:hypothetical protein
MVSMEFVEEIMAKSRAFERRVRLDNIMCAELNKILDSPASDEAGMSHALWRIANLLEAVGRREPSQGRRIGAPSGAALETKEGI